MRVRDTAVTFFVLGLITGMIVAFAGCSSSYPDRIPSQQTTGQFTG